LDFAFCKNPPLRGRVEHGVRFIRRFYPGFSAVTIPMADGATAVKPVEHKCGHCGIAAKLVCTRCREVRYCSQTCQKEAWAAHKTTCKPAPYVPTYATPPDSERCPACKGWGMHLLSAEREGHCASCWAAKSGGAAPPAPEASS